MKFFTPSQPSVRACLSRAGSFRVISVWAATVLIALSLAACSKSGTEAAAAERAPAPQFHLSTVGGGELGSEDVAGKIALLDFWATWCAPCHIQTEILHEIHGEFSGTDLRILSIDSGEEPSRVESFMAKNPAPYPVLVDEDGEVSDAFQVMGLPTLVILDREGKIAHSFTGIMEAEELRPLLRQLLAVPSAAG
jgi:peroxiredoxin